MSSLLHDFLHDLKVRAERILGDIRAANHGLPPIVGAYGLAMGKRAEKLVERINALLTDPDLQHPDLARNFFYDYKRLAELTDQLESYPVLALSRFNENDRAITALVHEICDEIGYPYPRPLAVAMSSQYYWAVPEMDLIFVPSSEPFHVLALPDLYHEIAHFILAREKKLFIQLLTDAIDSAFEQLKDDGRRKNWPTGTIEAIEEAHRCWNRGWGTEFACDMVATYCIGPAFGWSNVRLCTNMSSGLFVGAESHPADEARTRGIEAILTELSAEEPSTLIRTKWEELVTLSGERLAQDFDVVYPSELLKQFAEIVVDSCGKRGIKRWDIKNPGEGRIRGALNECWTVFMSDATTFAEFERRQIETLRQDFKP